LNRRSRKCDWHSTSRPRSGYAGARNANRGTFPHKCPPSPVDSSWNPTTWRTSVVRLEPPGGRLVPEDRESQLWRPRLGGSGRGAEGAASTDTTLRFLASDALKKTAGNLPDDIPHCRGRTTPSPAQTRPRRLRLRLILTPQSQPPEAPARSRSGCVLGGVRVFGSPSQSWTFLEGAAMLVECATRYRSEHPSAWGAIKSTAALGFRSTSTPLRFAFASVEQVL
jgi:hypothetical protein